MKHSSCVLGLHPSARGFGWALFEGPGHPFDAGTADIRTDKNKQALARIDALLKRYRPKVLALETFEGLGTRRSARIQSLYKDIVKLAAARRVAVRICTRAEIAAALGNARTREEIAAVVAKRFAVFRPRLPKARAIWESEHANMALFCAVGCALAFYASKR
jgi:hypothetical protein